VVASHGMQYVKDVKAGESHLNFWIETRTVLRFD